MSVRNNNKVFEDALENKLQLQEKNIYYYKQFPFKGCRNKISFSRGRGACF